MIVTIITAVAVVQMPYLIYKKTNKIVALEEENEINNQLEQAKKNGLNKDYHQSRASIVGPENREKAKQNQQEREE